MAAPGITSFAARQHRCSMSGVERAHLASLIQIQSVGAAVAVTPLLRQRIARAFSIQGKPIVAYGTLSKK